MALPEPFARVQRRDVLRDAFPGAEPLAVDGEGELGWWMSADALVCFTRVGRWAHGHGDHSFFVNARQLEWVAPDTPSSMPFGPGHHPGIPLPIRANQTGGRRLYLFVQENGAASFTFLGETGPSYAYGGKAYRQSASFELRRTVPSFVLRSLGLLDEPADARPLDARLRDYGSLTADERLDALRLLIEYWHGRLRPSDAYSASDLARVELPKPLRWWLGTGGRRDAVFNTQNNLLRLAEPYRLTVDGDKLVYFRENQGVWELATLPTGDDPRVWSRINEPGEPWVPEGMPLSAALLQCCLFEAVSQAPYGATALSVSAGFIEWLARHVEEVECVGFRLHGFVRRCFVGSGAFAVVMSDAGEATGAVYLGAQSEDALSFLRDQEASIWESAVF